MNNSFLSYWVFTFLIFFIQLNVIGQQSVLFVTIHTHPEDAIIKIDGKTVDRTNNMLELVKGKYSIIIERYGYYPQEATISVSRKNTSFNYSLKEDPSIDLPPEPQVAEEPAAEIIVEPVVVITEEPSMAIPKNYSLDIEMIAVEGGIFLMGKERTTGETSPHKVSVLDFEIGKYEISQEQWLAVMESNPSKFLGLQNPVDNVSWVKVQEFISKLNAKSGKKYRLPTEAEWEYAARGGANIDSDNSDKFSGGNDIDAQAWYWRNSGDTILAGRWDNEIIKQNHCRTQEVGQKKPNSLGIYDMTGNVWEWCSDWYSDEYYQNSSNSNPLGPDHGKTRVYRGGSYVSKFKYCPVYFRFSGNPEYGYNYLGFRLVLSE